MVLIEVMQKGIKETYRNSLSAHILDYSEKSVSPFVPGTYSRQLRKHIVKKYGSCAAGRKNKHNHLLPQLLYRIYNLAD